MIKGKLVVIVGATATGKSNLALKIADKFNGEIVNADSWTVRKYADIGTSKPTIEDRTKIPHHILDIVEPNNSFSAAEYKKIAENVIKSIYQKGKLPILVGGTGLYIDSLIYDYSFLPAASSQTRERLNGLKLAELHKIANKKGLLLESIDKQNKRRVIRLIETNGLIATKKEIMDDILIIGIKISKEQLDQNIQHRVNYMLAQGLEKEVEKLYKIYGWESETLKGIGYSEWRLYFEGLQSYDQTIERIIKDTRQLAKRQITWFKRNKSIQWVDTPVKSAYVEDLITAYLNKNICL